LQVFISYQRSDDDFARLVREHLVAHDVQTWMDRYDIPVGAYWPDEIDAGLTASDIVVGILSPDAVASRNVKNEWDWAIANDRRLLLLQVQPCVIPHRYISINFIDATGPDPAPALLAVRLALGIESLAGSDAPPRTQYARSGDVSIAYQVFGDGPIDLVVTPGFVSNVDLIWDEPVIARYHRQLSSFARVTVFDKRGTGLSDRVANVPTLEQRIDDLRAVMDAAGVERAALMGVSEGGPMSIKFAATHPERTIALVLYGAGARHVWAPDYPWDSTVEELEREEEIILRSWGEDMHETLVKFAPSIADDAHYITWFARYVRASASPGAAVALQRMNRAIDVRDVLPRINVPALVVHRTGDRDIPIEAARYVASRIPGATLVELPGDDHLPYFGDQDALIETVRSFLNQLPTGA
jgi:pimeloyl-ACP methyl ester carboxylesterase